jgi:ubiquinone/menaquinone biosynthesis C-methylase UbiE
MREAAMDNYEMIKADFNEIAELGPEPKWNHNNCYFEQLMKLVPERTGTCLDIGCGKGALSLLLSRKAESVIAVDLADKMIKYARGHSAAANIHYICGNIVEMPLNNESLDVIITTATAHHLSYEWLLEFSKRTLRKGGKLIILDLAKAASPADYIVWGAAFFPNLVMSLVKNGRLRKDGPHAAAVWRKHGAHDAYMTLREIRRLADAHLPGAVVKRKLFWRYSLVWEKK